MLIPSQAVALVWSLRAQGRSDAEILEMLRKPLTEAPYASPIHDWFARWRKARGNADALRDTREARQRDATYESEAR